MSSKQASCRRASTSTPNEEEEKARLSVIKSATVKDGTAKTKTNQAERLIIQS
jgi:hypothetical protein